MKTNDAINFIRKLSLPKLANMVIVTAAYYLARLTQTPVQWGVPFNISVEPTTNCNLGCPECPSGLKSFTRPTGNMETKFYENVVDELADKLT